MSDIVQKPGGFCHTLRHGGVATGGSRLYRRLATGEPGFAQPLEPCPSQTPIRDGIASSQTLSEFLQSRQRHTARPTRSGVRRAETGFALAGPIEARLAQARAQVEMQL